jgi:GNAT superfamily N-acetyltransferase
VSDSAIGIRPMLLADLAVQQTLVELAGWNQLPVDLERLWRHQPDGCFVATVSGAAVATITTTSHGADVAWIGMMLVHPDFRRRGIATLLMRHAIACLRQQNIRCIKLDATPEGAVVYPQLGFQAEYELTRYSRPAKGAAATIRPTVGAWEVPAVDRTTFGADRSAWLRRLAADSRVEATAAGYGMIRPGRLAAYLGPVVAVTPTAAQHIVARLLEGVDGPVFWDVPAANEPAQELARSLGFVPVRRLTRMWAGTGLVAGCPERQYGLTDFATG